MSLLCQLQMTLPWDFQGVFGVTVRLMSDRELWHLEVLRDVDQSSRCVPRAALLDNALAAVNDVRGMLLCDEFSRSN